MSLEEIKRLGSAAKTAAEFVSQWKNDFWWCDDEVLRQALMSARTQLITLGGDPRPDGDAIQCAVLDKIDAALT